MSNFDSTWNIDILRIVTFSDERIPFTEETTSISLTGVPITASIRQEENGEIRINEATQLENGSLFDLSYFENQNIIEFSLNINELPISLDESLVILENYTRLFYEKNNFKIKRIGIIAELYNTSFTTVKDKLPIINTLNKNDDFDIRLNKVSEFNGVKINQAINFCSAEKLFIKIEEPFNIPIAEMKKVTRLVVDVNTDIENELINDKTSILMKLVALSKKLIISEGVYE
ncbi:hypothetical protein ACFGW3_05940 [Pasteurella multocida]|uniref:hypothetical protein n=1 Tax=Pasteurella multocida TaxID=747 RepID=UPI0035F2C801